jgi:hypothetical protein
MNTLQKLSGFISLFFLIFINPMDAEEFKWQDYKPFTIKQAMAEFSHEPINGYAFDFGFMKYKVKVIYSGKSRAINKDTQDFIGLWHKAIGENPKIADSFEHEILVQEESQEYWLPIQEILLKPFENEIKSSQKVDLFIMFLGIMKNGDYFFVVNEFQGE